MGADVEGAAEQAAQAGLDLPGRTARHLLVGQIAPVAGHIGRVQAFGRRLADREAQILAERRIARRYGCVRNPLAQSGFEQGARRDDRLGRPPVTFECGDKLFGGGG